MSAGLEPIVEFEKVQAALGRLIMLATEAAAQHAST
jgi:hypothetical protein